MKIMLCLDKEDLKKMNYPIVVECWDRVMTSMSRKRKYDYAFSPNEHKIIQRYYRLFCKWHLKTGTPKQVTMSSETYELLKSAVDFFATIG